MVTEDILTLPLIIHNHSQCWGGIPVHRWGWPVRSLQTLETRLKMKLVFFIVWAHIGPFVSQMSNGAAIITWAPGFEHVRGLSMTDNYTLVAGFNTSQSNVVQFGIIIQSRNGKSYSKPPITHFLVQTKNTVL